MSGGSIHTQRRTKTTQLQHLLRPNFADPERSAGALVCQYPVQPQLRVDKRSAIAVADALKSALRLLPAQILLELAHVIKRTAALPAQALEITLRFAVG
jgi:hypothetical protein